MSSEKLKKFGLPAYCIGAWWLIIKLQKKCNFFTTFYIVGLYQIKIGPSNCQLCVITHGKFPVNIVGHV